jgi:hypothetical protein
MPNNRVMYCGDSYPAALLQIQDETGVLNLTAADSVEVQWLGADFEFSGPGLAIWPAEADPNGSSHWNLSYAFASGDTANADVYTPYVVVTWSTGEIETFPTSDTLTVMAFPVPA